MLYRTGIASRTGIGLTLHAEFTEINISDGGEGMAAVEASSILPVLVTFRSDELDALLPVR
jgi:hypothetical protein